jgi:hypothetical protein
MHPEACLERKKEPAMSMKCNAAELRSDYGDLSATGFTVSERPSARICRLLKSCGVPDRLIAHRTSAQRGRR